jgi:hypothetical protein
LAVEVHVESPVDPSPDSVVLPIFAAATTELERQGRSRSVHVRAADSRSGECSGEVDGDVARPQKAARTTQTSKSGRPPRVLSTAIRQAVGRPVRSDADTIRVLILTTFDLEDYVLEALRERIATAQ